MGRDIQIVSENPLKQIWLFLAQYESLNSARRLIAERTASNGLSLDDDLLDAKAQGLAYFLRNARGYLVEPPADWTQRIVLAYYGLMSLVGAILVAAPNSPHTLSTLELVTTQGHGLKSIVVPGLSFPVSERVYLSAQGFFAAYLDSLGVAAQGLCISKRDAEKAVADPSGLNPLLVSLDGLMGRIPEISQLFYDVLGRNPLCLQVWHSSANMHEDSEERRTRGIGSSISIGGPQPRQHTWVGLKAPGPLDQAQVVDLGIPLVEVRMSRDLTANPPYWEGKLEGAPGSSWWSKLGTSKSSMSSSRWIKPVLPGVSDELAVHLMLLYELSIITRYRPKLWREVMEGEHDSFFVLIRAYLEAFDRVVPEVVLQRVSGRRVLASVPGSLSSPI